MRTARAVPTLWLCRKTMISRTAFCSAQAATMRPARTGPMPSPSRRRVDLPGSASGEQREEFMRFPALACAVLSAGSAHAASISVESTGPDKPPVVVVQGSFEGKDGEQFFRKTGSLTAALVRLESNGGSLVAGIQIGETIRLKGLQTLVPAGT